MKKVLVLTIGFLLCISVFGCSISDKPAQTAREIQQGSESSQKADVETKATEAVKQSTEKQSTEKDTEASAYPVSYKNTKYGFTFDLPKTWKGFTIVEEKWEGLAVGGEQGEKVVETGPELLIRHPEWTSQNPRQDIPIMIFTLAQWDSLQKEKFHIGAAPIGPSELGRNSKYVFALPARYNYAFPTGFEEVEKILESKPLHPFD